MATQTETTIVHSKDQLERNGGPVGNGGTWGGPNTRRPRPAMTGLEFSTIRRESEEQRDAAPQMSAMNKIARGDFAAIVGECEALRALCATLQGQVETLQRQLAAKNPPHLAKVEKR